MGSVFVSHHFSPDLRLFTTSKTLLKMKYLLAVSCLLAVAAAVPRMKRQVSTPDNFVLPSNATAVLSSQINYGFDCSGRQYGFYADPANNCQIFHVCLPVETEEGLTETNMWSFICGLGSIFDQAQLVCNYLEDSLPCSEAESFYRINDYFGREDLEFSSDLSQLKK